MIDWLGIGFINLYGFVDVITSMNKYSRYEAYYFNRRVVNMYKKNTCDFKDYIYYNDKYKNFDKKYKIFNNLKTAYWLIDHFRREQLMEPDFDMRIWSVNDEECKTLIENKEPVKLINNKCYVKKFGEE